MAITVNLTDRSEAGAPITAAQYNTTIQAIETAFAGATADDDFTPVETLANSALQPADITSGTITPFTGDLDMSGGADGEVLTVQADGSAAWEAFPGGGDMLAATYDPQTIEDDAFALSTHTGTVSTSQIADNAVTNDKIRDCAALSVIGNTTNGSAGPADISTTAGSLHVLREASNVIGFGALSTAYITSGTFADARIAESNVTQHAAALTVTVSQISDAGDLAALNQVDSPQIATGAVGLDQLEATAVTPDSYTLASITVTADGRITAASNGTGTDASGSRVATSTGALTVTTTDHEVTKGITLTTDQSSAVFTISDDVAAGKIFKFHPVHDGATIVVEGDAGSIDGEAGGTCNLINGGPSFLEVVSNAGTAPVCVTYGDVIHAPAEVNGTKTYDVNDSNQEFVLVSGAGNQTMPAVAGMPKGWEVAVYNESGGNISVIGGDATITLADNDFCVIKKPHTSMLAFGSFSTGKAVLDAA